MDLWYFFVLLSTLRVNNSMRHRWIFVIFAALESFHWELQRRCFRYLSYCWLDVCARRFKLHVTWWLSPDRHSNRDFSHFQCISHCSLLRTSITQCATDKFALFLKRWNSFIEGYHIDTFDIYHIVDSVCVLKDFNCMLFDN